MYRRTAHWPGSCQTHGVAGALIVLAAGSHAARAEDVTLISGEVIYGDIVGQTAGYLTIQHQLLGDLQVPMETIALIDDVPFGVWLGQADMPAGPMTILATNEAELPEVASSVSKAGGDATDAEQDVSEEVKAMDVIAGGQSDKDAGQQESQQTPPPPPPEWDVRLELGLLGTHGNNEEMNLRAGVWAERQTESSRVALDGSYRFGTNHGDRSENKWAAGALLEWPFKGTRWTGFLQSRVECDEFASWDYRLTSGGGFQYRLLEDESVRIGAAQLGKLDLTLRGGFGLRQEFGSSNTGLSPEGLLGANTRWEITPRTRINAESTLYPDIRENGEFRLVSKADWTIDIDHMDGVSFKIGVEHEYDSQVNAGFDNNDIRGYATVVVKF